MTNDFGHNIVNILNDFLVLRKLFERNLSIFEVKFTDQGVDFMRKLINMFEFDNKCLANI